MSVRPLIVLFAAVHLASVTQAQPATQAQPVTQAQPAPATAARKPFSAPVLQWSQGEREAGFPKMDSLFAHHVVARGPRVHGLPDGKPVAAFAPGGAGSAQLEQYMTDHKVAGIVVLQDGQLRLERYGLGHSAAGRWTSFSVAKSVTSTLVGAAIKDGYIKSVDEKVTTYITGLRGSAYDDVTIRQLLTMTSGVKWNEDYTDPKSDVGQLFNAAIPPGADRTVTYMRGLQREAPPGAKWVYKTGETNLIGVLVMAATKQTLAGYLSEKIWRPYGMEQNATWLVDEIGHEAGGTSLQVSLRDYARIGQFIMDGAKVNGRAIVPDGWLEAGTRKQAETGDPAGGYGYQWWTMNNGTFQARGIHGQYIHIDAKRKLVIAINSAWPVATGRAQSRARLNIVDAITQALDEEQAAPAGAPFDVALVGGRVMDPETQLDAVRAVGIRDGKIAYVGFATPRARDTVRVAGQVIAPGFIDLHAHGQDDLNYGYLARDGVTTALEMEIGVYPVAPWYAAREGKARINFGATVGHPAARHAMLQGDSLGGEVLFADGPWARATIPAARLPELDRRLEAGLRDGALGVGMGINYTIAATREEIVGGFAVAAKAKVPVYVHLRSAGPLNDGGGMAGLQEVLADAAGTGASLHVVHLTSMGLSATGSLLRLIDRARARGADVTTEAYPYTAGATSLGAAIFDPGFQERLGITYGDILIPSTGERLTKETFDTHRALGSGAIIFMIPDSAADIAYRSPHVMVASDGGLSQRDGKVFGHPRSAGTHARILGSYVRERKVIGLMDAVSKLSYLPARRLETADPAMKRKGRVQVGADADLTVFDPARVNDKATYENAAQYSVGITHVMVNGTFVVRDEKLVEGAKPGRAVRRSAVQP